MSRVRVTHTFDLLDEAGQPANRDDIDYVVGTMTVQVEEPVLGYGPGPFNDRPVKVDVIDLDAERGRAVDVALGQFWSTIADFYPYITTGDLDPGTRAHFDNVARDAVTTWKRYNNPQPNTYALANPAPADPV